MEGARADGQGIRHQPQGKVLAEPVARPSLEPLYQRVGVGDMVGDDVLRLGRAATAGVALESDLSLRQAKQLTLRLPN